MASSTVICDATEPPAVCQTPEEISTPDEPPPSCHPALLKDDEYRAIHLAFQTREFHRELCYRLEKITQQPSSNLASRKRKRGSYASETTSALSNVQRSDTQDSHSSVSSAGSISTQPSETSDSSDSGDSSASSKRLRWYDDSYDTPLSSGSPHSVDEPVKPTDFSWWRALTPTPPDSPRLNATLGYGHITRMEGLIGCG